MPASMSFADHLTVISDNSTALRAAAASLSMADPVPTCPGWTVADLVEHHGGVCRWAAKIVGEHRTANLSNAELEVVMAPPTDQDQLLDWYTEGVARLLASLAGATDGPALVFLRDAPLPPRLFWARRCAHETTIHRVDALSATLGHLPTAAGTGISADLALDGIDELVMGFVPRRTSNLRADEPITVTIEPDDTSRAWTVVVGAGPPVSSVGVTADPDATLTGSPVGLYLGLWNRGDDIAEHGAAPVLGLWRDKVRVSWA